MNRVATQRHEEGVDRHDEAGGDRQQRHAGDDASAAPKLAAAEMPSVKGLASGLVRMVCICAPATESAAPTTTAITATGMRMSQITVRT